MFKLSQIWPMEMRSHFFLYPFDLSLFFKYFLAFWHKMFQIQIVLSLPQLWNLSDIFPRSLGSF